MRSSENDKPEKSSNYHKKKIFISLKKFANHFDAIDLRNRVLNNVKSKI